MNKLNKPKYSDYKVEVETEFTESNNWVGIQMKIQDFIKCVYCESKQEKEQTLLYAHKFDPNHVQAIQI